MVSGVRVLSYMRWTRRDRFILAAALSFGVGDLLCPTIFTHLFDGVKNPSNGLQGLIDSITIVLSTPCTCFVSFYTGYGLTILKYVHVVLVSGIVAVILNGIIPQETAMDVEEIDVERIEHGSDTRSDVDREGREGALMYNDRSYELIRDNVFGRFVARNFNHRRTQFVIVDGAISCDAQNAV